jgi:hypothetical protein
MVGTLALCPPYVLRSWDETGFIRATATMRALDLPAEFR